MLEKLMTLATLEPGWNGEGGKPISAAAIRKALSIEVVPCSTGGLQLEVHRDGDDLEIEIAPSGQIKSVCWEREA